MQPETFERSLQNYDPALTIRWGHVVKCWVVERRCYVSPALMDTLVDGMKKAIQFLPHPELDDAKRYMLQKACEEGYSAGFGKRVVVYAKYLDNRVFDALRLTDLQNTGNIQRALERSKNHDEKKKKDRYEVYAPLGKEVVSVIDWANRKHSAEVDGGKAPQLMAEAFKKEAPKGTKKHYDLLDAHGRSMKPNKDVKIQLARA